MACRGPLCRERLRLGCTKREHAANDQILAWTARHRILFTFVHLPRLGGGLGGTFPGGGLRPGPTGDLGSLQGTEAKACQQKGRPRNAQKWPEKPRDHQSAPLPPRDPRKSTANMFPDVSGSFCGSLAGFPGCRADSGLFWVCDFQWQTCGSRSLCGALQGGPWPAGALSAGSD